MSTERIDPEVIEAGVVALVAVYASGRSELDEAAVEAAIRAADEKRGTKEQWRARLKGVGDPEGDDLESVEEHGSREQAQAELDDLIADADPEYERTWLDRRLVSDWRPAGDPS